MRRHRKHFRQLVDQHKDRVYSFARYLLGNQQDAEDVTQDVLLRLWRHGMSLDPEVLPAWLSRVTRNACIDQHRKNRSFSSVVQVDSEQYGFLAASSDIRTPEQMVEATEFRDQLKWALSRIDEPIRSIVILREIQDLKYAQIAETVNLPLNTVKVYLHRGRKMLREQLQKVLTHESV